ncbi:hypothetical protein [Streptomyces sp. TP-A0874]|uniref:hypothetical protein n=1 Tax=Streptomyces sp. TP-A0874 TaxID=549819 RepID=UPI00085306A6|nr:hypothetical protein [Streptomyces sp. TP-A0874]
MLGFDDVLNVRLSALDDAVSDWTATVKRLRHLAEEDAPAMRRKSDQADWKGENAAVTKPFVRKTAKEFDDALKEATSIRNILRDAKKKFAEHRTALQNLIEEAPQHQVHIDARGTVRSTKVQAPLSADYWQNTPALAPQHTDDKAVTAMAGRIKKVLEAATHDDELVAEALNAIVGDNPHNFTETSMRGIKDAQALEDAETALKLANKGNDLTDAELVRFNKLLKSNRENPVFAETFATGLGAKNTLQLWRDVADPGVRDAPHGERAKTLAQVQDNLSFTLATATRSDSRAMAEWEQDVIKYGSQRFPLETSHNAPFGYQIMSNLMRKGEYDADFLEEYGDSLVTFERETTSDPKDLWLDINDRAHLNFTGEENRGKDLGNDPMTGFLEALGHNPEASTEFFSSSTGGEKGHPLKSLSNLSYLLGANTEGKEVAGARTWFADVDLHHDGARPQGRENLGHALEAATLGSPYDEPGHNQHESATPEEQEKARERQASVMEAVVATFGASPSLLDDEVELNRSLARMAVGHIDNLDYSIYNFGGSAETANRDGLFAETNGNRNSFHDFDRNASLEFLKGIAKEKESYELISAGQQIYTASGLAAHTDDWNTAMEFAYNGMEVHSLLDQSRSDAIREEFGDKNEKLEEQAEWRKYALSTTLGLAAEGATAGAAFVFTGPVSGPVAEVVVPVVGDAVTGAVDTWYENRTVDRLKEATDKNDAEADQLISRGLSDSQNAAMRPLLNHAALVGADEKVAREMRREALQCYSIYTKD